MIGQSSIRKKYIKNIDFNKKIGVIIFIIMSLIIGLIFFYKMSTNVFFYIDKDSKRIFSEKRSIPIFHTEKKIKTLLRTYLSGSLSYRGKVPFTQQILLKGLTYNKRKRILILNWNAFFFKEIYYGTIDLDIEVFLKTMKKNTKIEKIYFLIENTQLPIFFDKWFLDKGISISNYIL